MLMDCDKGKPKYKLYNNTEDLEITSFWYHSNETKRNPYDSSSHLHTTVQLCYKLFGITQMVTKSQKVHISSYDKLQILHNNNFGWH